MCKKDFAYLKTQVILKKGEWDPPNVKRIGKISGCQHECGCQWIYKTSRSKLLSLELFSIMGIFFVIKT